MTALGGDDGSAQVMRVTAQVSRPDGWWAVEVPDVPGLFTQARTLDQVPAAVIDAVALMTGVPEASVIVRVEQGGHPSGGA